MLSPSLTTFACTLPVVGLALALVMNLRSMVHSFLKPGSLRSALRALIPAPYRQQMREWLNADGSEQWCRVVMNQEIERFIRTLDCSKIDALEISGTGSQGRYNFLSYQTVGYPNFDICEKPLSENQFDLVIAEQVLEHVVRPDRATANVFRMLRSGGVFVVSTPFLLKIHEHPLDLYRWTERGMKQLLEGAGFEVLKTASWGNRRCLVADMTPGLAWTKYNPRKHSLENEPQFPIVIWAFAQKPCVK